MMQFEFEALTGATVTAEEYATIEEAYMLSEYNKQEFAALWVKINRGRIQKQKKEAADRAERYALAAKVQEIALAKFPSTFDYRTMACNYFTPAQMETLKAAGIHTDNLEAWTVKENALERARQMFNH